MSGPIQQSRAMLGAANGHLAKAIALNNQTVTEVNEVMVMVQKVHAGLPGSDPVLAALTGARQELAKYGVLLQKIKADIDAEIARLQPRS